jgi:acetoin utilization protein AcuC
MRIPFFYHHEFSSYDFGPSHPFQGSRFERFLDELERRFPAVRERLDIREAEPAPDELLVLAHDRAYIERVVALEKRRGYLSPDTQLLPGSVKAARFIVGASVAAAREAARSGFAMGFGGLHHAGRDFGEGFCIFNDVAVAAAALLGDGMERVAVLDTDAHQGNGTMDIFYDDPRVLFISIHQDPHTLYPGVGFVSETGSGTGEGCTVNIPMPMLADGPLYNRAMREIVHPLIDEYRPQAIIRNGGSDPLYTDTLTNLGLDIDQLSGLIRGIAEHARRSGIPLVDLFLSGYGLYVTEGWLAILRGALGETMALEIPERRTHVSPGQYANIEQSARLMLDELKRRLAPRWKIF